MGDSPYFEESHKVVKKMINDTDSFRNTDTLNGTCIFEYNLFTFNIFILCNGDTEVYVYVQYMD